MADMTLCASDDCPVRAMCQRNDACPSAYPASGRRQSYAMWHPEAGAGCPGFIDANHKLQAEIREPPT